MRSRRSEVVPLQVSSVLCEEVNLVTQDTDDRGGETKTTRLLRRQPRRPNPVDTDIRPTATSSTGARRPTSPISSQGPSHSCRCQCPLLPPCFSRTRRQQTVGCRRLELEAATRHPPVLWPDTGSGPRWPPLAPRNPGNAGAPVRERGAAAKRATSCGRGGFGSGRSRGGYRTRGRSPRTGVLLCR